ncbi:efflux transporter outer membrane subunit [Dongia sp.]|uniref:efflux transporter outer membrane subunit n=1 Tax=Dongia sp. TaxID=1977262 RepID=UPI0035B3F574
MRDAPILLFLLALLSGCDLLADPTQPDIKTPVAWVAPMPAKANIWPAADWWRGFGSGELDGLILAARNNNLDIGMAAARVEQAEAQMRSTSSSLWPQLNLGFDASRDGPLDADAAAEESGTGSSSSSGGGSGSTSMDRNSFGLSLSASYEVDFWGRNRSDRTAALESLRASVFDQQTVALTATTSVASTYLQILSVRDRIAIADSNLANARDVLQVVEAKTRLGAVSPADLAQQTGEVAAREAALPPLEQEERESTNALAILLGRNPEDMTIEERSLDSLQAPPLATGLPSALLQRRPDIAKAEADLAAADANVVAARAAMLPSVNLSGALSLETAVLSTLFGPAGAAYSVAGSIMQPIFDGGKLAADADLTEAQRKELILNYRSVIVTAFSEVENALGSVAALERQVRLQEVQVEAADKAFRIVRTRYKSGSDDLVTLLDAQRTLFDAQDGLGQLRLQQLQAIVTLYKSLGGGWEQPGTAE